MTKVAINGFGRIGRLAFRQMFGSNQRFDKPEDACSPAEVRYRSGWFRRQVR